MLELFVDSVKFGTDPLLDTRRGIGDVFGDAFGELWSKKLFYYFIFVGFYWNYPIAFEKWTNAAVKACLSWSGVGLGTSIPGDVLNTPKCCSHLAANAVGGPDWHPIINVSLYVLYIIIIYTFTRILNRTYRLKSVEHFYI